MTDPKELERLCQIGACVVDGLPFDKDGNPRKRYVRVTYDGSSCVVLPDNVPAMTGDSPEDYTLADIYLSEQEMETLPEFGGF